MLEEVIKMVIPTWLEHSTCLALNLPGAQSSRCWWIIHVYCGTFTSAVAHWILSSNNCKTYMLFSIDPLTVDSSYSDFSLYRMIQYTPEIYKQNKWHTISFFLNISWTCLKAQNIWLQAPYLDFRYEQRSNYNRERGSRIQVVTLLWLTWGTEFFKTPLQVYFGCTCFAMSVTESMFSVTDLF